MKKLICVYILMNISLLAFPQAIHIYHDGEKTPEIVANGGIDSIYFAPEFGSSTEYQPIFVTTDGVKRYDVVDSVKFNLPHLVATRHAYVCPYDDGIEINFSVSFNGKEVETRPQIISPHQNAQFVTGHGWHANWLWSGGGWINAKSYGGDADVYTEKWRFKSGDMQDSIIIKCTGKPFLNNAYKICFSADETEWFFDTNYPNTKLFFDVPGVDWFYNEAGKPVVHFTKNESGERRHVQISIYTDDFKKIALLDQMRSFMHTSDEHMAALHDFCDATDFENWGKKTNWWSDEPLWKWDFSVNKEKFDDYYWHINDHVVSLYFGGGQYTGVHGTLPTSFEVFMDDVDGELNLECCALYGMIPNNILCNNNWSKYGWGILMQDPWFGGGFDIQYLNLHMEDEEIMYVDRSKGTAYEELAKHKLTYVSVGAPSEAFCNLCLDYANKGFEYIYAAQDWYGGTLEDVQQLANDFKNVPNVLACYGSWANGDLRLGLGCLGSSYLLDSEGNVIDYMVKDWDIDEKFYTDRLKEILLKYLGEPEEHEPYIPKPIYTSTDYSHDGEVQTLQKATIGKGIDLVFMGDMYVDTLLVDGGLYEQDMRAAMEYFFEIEPYKTLRDRFNVYAIKVVSPNGLEGTAHKFNFNNDLVFEYVQKVPDVDMDHVAVTVINNDKNIFFVGGETAMWEGGASIAWIEKGGPSNIICHETGGHGIAKLLDEYIYGGYEENHTQEGANEGFREWIKTSYHDKGWGMNVSATDEPEDVPWAHFLKDERYQYEVGIYKGAWYWPEELWRPSENSVMRESSYLWFNAPSREAIYKKVMQLSEGDDWTYDYETFVKFDTPFREADKQAMAKVRKLEGEGLDVQKPRIELRPPTIYKGSWRDTGNCEKMTFDNEKFVQPNTSKRKMEKSMGMGTRMDRKTQQKQQKPYFMYQGTRYDVDEFDKKWFNMK